MVRRRERVEAREGPTPSRLELLPAVGRVCAQLPVVSRFWRVAFHGLPASAVPVPGGGDCAPFGPGNPSLLQEHVEASLLHSPALFPPDAEAGELSQGPCADLPTRTEGVAVVKGPSAPDGVREARSLIRGFLRGGPDGQRCGGAPEAAVVHQHPSQSIQLKSPNWVQW